MQRREGLQEVAQLSVRERVWCVAQGPQRLGGVVRRGLVPAVDELRKQLHALRDLPGVHFVVRRSSTQAGF